MALNCLSGRSLNDLTQYYIFPWILKNFDHNILNWFNFLTGHPPMAQTVLLCNEETTSEELTAFMYRAFLCQYPVFFMIGKIELLTSDKRQTLTNLINILFDIPLSNPF